MVLHSPFAEEADTQIWLRVRSVVHVLSKVKIYERPAAHAARLPRHEVGTTTVKRCFFFYYYRFMAIQFSRWRPAFCIAVGFNVYLSRTGRRTW